ncbi:MAG: SDR family oxidoreductase [Myxococcales bacterium]|nr:SDR family oxidoreductase [Myxococcales bacterium]
MSQIILITGATSGIGRHAALHLARQGHRVIATGRRRAALDSLRAEAGEHWVRCVPMDVTDLASIDAARTSVDQLTDGHGVDVLINNAGFGQGGAVLDVDPADVAAQYHTNVFGLLCVTRAFAPAMIGRGHGKIVNVSSLGGRLTLPMMGVYTSTKFAVEALSDALRIELAPLGVHVAVVQPGSIRTEFNQTMQGTTRKVERTGPWAAVYDHTDRVATAFEQYSSGPIVISRVLARIVNARRPRARYFAPFRESVLMILGTWLPTRVTDFVLARVFGVTSARPHAPALTQAWEAP